jgi:ubiquinone/menaquinone biosynthesis C-methylase UbiE
MDPGGSCLCANSIADRARRVQGFTDKSVEIPPTACPLAGRRIHCDRSSESSSEAIPRWRGAVPDLDAIYRSRAAEYDALVAREDHGGQIAQALGRLAPTMGRDVVELGAGTGRLTALVAQDANRVLAMDRSRHMLAYARVRLTRARLAHCMLATADHRQLPVADGVADLVLAGWTICYTVLDSGRAWQRSLGQALGEMRRVARPGATIVILETLGTGHEVPQAPDELLPYYQHLETAGFAQEWIRTDYRFASVEEAQRLVRFFFGDALADRVAAEGATVVPECTGIWWQRL